jgi:hypothetical protein
MPMSWQLGLVGLAISVYKVMNLPPATHRPLLLSD